jgi:hypothetical protein
MLNARKREQQSADDRLRMDGAHKHVYALNAQELVSSCSCIAAGDCYLRWFNLPRERVYLSIRRKSFTSRHTVDTNFPPESI